MRISTALEAAGAAAFVGAGFLVGIVPGLLVVGAVFCLAGLNRDLQERQKVEPRDDDSG